MSQDNEIKIRTLPRKNEKPKDEPKAEVKAAPVPPRWIIYVGSTSAIALVAMLVLDRAPLAKNPAPTVQQKDLASQTLKLENEAVTRHLRESHLRQEMMVQAQKIQNLNSRSEDLEADPVALDPTRIYGVQLDQENTSDRIYEDLNGPARSSNGSTPDEMINAKLANRKWVNELERRERVTFVREFIRSAYDQGYEVQLDENLVVIGVKKITEQPKMNIDQIIDRIASKQGF